MKLRKHTEVLGDARDARASKRRGSIQTLFLNKLFRFGALVVCYVFFAPALAQTYDVLPLPADITIDNPPVARSADRWKWTARCCRSSGERTCNRVNALRMPVSGSVTLPFAVCRLPVAMSASS